MFLSQGTGQYSPTHDAAGLHVAIEPRTYKPGARPVLWCHSAGGNAAEPVLASNNALTILDQITAMFHCPIISFDAAGTSWGNDTAQACATDALAYLRSAFGASAAAPILLGISMGGMLTLNWIRANPTLFAAAVLMYPATSLQAIHDGTGGAQNGAATTEAAYGGSLATFNAAVVAHDPAQNAASYTGKPIHMQYSDSDTVVGTANQTAFVTAVGGAALETQVLAGAAHADMTRLNVNAMLSFMARFY